MKRLIEKLVDFLWNPKQFTLTYFIVLFFLLLLIQSSVVGVHRVVSGSMEDTLLVGDFVLVNKIWYSFRLPFPGAPAVHIRDVRKNDVVLIEYPFDPNQIFVKRCVATGGDIVGANRKILSVNGAPVPAPATAKFASPDTIPADRGRRDFFGPNTVPPGSFFVMGDNRDFSYDSRLWGSVPEKHLIGKAVMILWSAGPDARFSGIFGPYRKGRSFMTIR